MEQHPPDYGDAESLPDFLYWVYTEYNPIDNDAIKRQFVELRQLLAMSPQEYDPVFYLISDLCLEHGRMAFIEGLRLGVTLMDNLLLNQENSTSCQSI